MQSSVVTNTFRIESLLVGSCTDVYWTDVVATNKINSKLKGIVSKILFLIFKPYS